MLKGKQRLWLLLVLLLVSLIPFLTPVSLYPLSLRASPHGDKNKLPNGCASCHRGHGQYNTPMLPLKKEVFCFRCHGNNENVEETRRKGDLAGNTKAADLHREFEKTYRHPFERIGIHRFGETLPETDSSMPRHSECEDCHHHHYVTTENKMAGVEGVNRYGAKVTSVSFEYELCFKCHSYSANLPMDQTNKADMFDIANPSYHPVIAPGRNKHVPSLIYPLTVTSLIKCTDCHNNDDPVGPKGPHGSNYRYILSKNFVEADGPEGALQYELCYSCHSRNSILNNESFPFHNRHISSSGISCRTCHNPHGSRQNAHLIDFGNNPFITFSSTHNKIEYRDTGLKAGECFLNCHGKDHDPAVYPATSSPPTSSNFFRS